MLQQEVTTKSGNKYYCQPAWPKGVDVCSEQFAPFGENRLRVEGDYQREVTFNRIEYFVRATFVLTREKFKPAFDLYITRGHFDSATESARKKARAEIAEAAGIYVQQHTAHMRAGIVKSLSKEADMKEGDADKAAQQASDLRAEANNLRTQAEEWAA
jgi:hypothetical protein